MDLTAAVLTCPPTTSAAEFESLKQKSTNSSRVPSPFSNASSSCKLSKSYYYVTGMTCSSCVAKIERELKKKTGLCTWSYPTWEKRFCYIQQSDASCWIQLLDLIIFLLLQFMLFTLFLLSFERSQYSLNYPPSFIFRYLERLVRSLVYLPIDEIKILCVECLGKQIKLSST